MPKTNLVVTRVGDLARSPKKNKKWNKYKTRNEKVGWKQEHKNPSYISLQIKVGSIWELIADLFVHVVVVLATAVDNAAVVTCFIV